MTTLEKMFAQIFERKDAIIEQVQQQADFYTQHLASRLLIDGITPPSWLLSPNSNRQSSDPNELGKEEIISKLILRPPRDSTRFSTGGRSVYYRPGVAGGSINERLSTEMCMESLAPNKAVNLNNEPVLTLECQSNDIVRSLDHVPEVDDCAKSPQNEMDARITSIYAAPDMSLARIQRSKSRQKARELRTSGKTAAKSCSSNDNRTHISFSGESKSKKDFNQVIQDKSPSDMSKCNKISGETSMVEEGKGEKGNDRTSHGHELEKFSSSYKKPSIENVHNKMGSSSDEKKLDGGIMVEPKGDSLQQSRYGHGVIEVANLPDVFLGSHAGQKSISGKTLGTQSQSNLLCGRITRSRSLAQQTTGINKSSKLTTSVSCNPKGGGAVSHSIGDSMHEINNSNKLSGAVETSEVLSDVNVETQAICSNEGVSKPLISTCIDMKESLLGANHQEVPVIIVGNEQIEEPVARQPLNPGAKLDPLTVCMESEGSALRQSSDCCMNVKPKQLNFDETYQCDLNEICSSLSKKRKLDGLLGKECYPLKGSASSLDHKSSCNILEKQSLKQNEISSGPETTRAHSYNSIDELAKCKMTNVGTDTNENAVVEDVGQNSKSTLHDDIDVTCKEYLSPKEVDDKIDKELHLERSHLNEDMPTKEDDIGLKSAADVHIPISNIKSSFTSNLTKQGNNGFEDGMDKEVKNPEADLDCSKSKEFEVGKNAKLSKMKLSSAKVNTWPVKLQKNVEGQPNCFSDSRNFRVHIQRDAIHCDLETPSNGLELLEGSASTRSSEKIHLSQSDGMQSCDNIVHDEIICDLSERTESLLESQAVEVVVTDVNDDSTEITHTLKQSESTSVVSDGFTPVYEGFIVDEEIGNVNIGSNEGGIDFDTLEIPSTTIARASIIEKLCKSASMQTPLSQFSSTFKQHQVQGLYGLMADGILKHMDLGTTVSIDEDSTKHLETSDSGITKIDSLFRQQQKIDYGTPFCWQSKNHYSSPVGKLWERSASSSGSSEIQLGSNPDLTCFPIEEDPSSNEENENTEEMHDELQVSTSPDVENENPIRVSTEMKIERENEDEAAVEIQVPLIESTEVCTQHGNNVPKSSMKYPDRNSSNSVSIEVSVPRKRDKVKYMSKVHHGIKVQRYDEENQNSSIATRASSRGNVSITSKNKSSMRSGITRLSQKEAKRNNIVSNITSFIPIVQQKQAAAVCTGKRDIKVKALEAAEAAKRREQEKENERKLKKEALKLERARIEKENAKVMELKRKEQQELKKKEADIAAKKRQREEEERKQLAKKRKLVAESQKNQTIKYEKPRGGKLDSVKHVKNDAMAGNKKKTESLRQNKNADENCSQKHDTGLTIGKTLANVIQQVTFVPENHDASNESDEKDKATHVHQTSPVKVIPVKLTSREKSYDISPYRCSDDEDDDEEDDLPTKKFVPSWASKSRVAMALPLQEKLDPESIFSVDRFCSMDEILLPRRLQTK